MNNMSRTGLKDDTVSILVDGEAGKGARAVGACWERLA